MGGPVVQSTLVLVRGPVLLKWLVLVIGLVEKGARSYEG